MGALVEVIDLVKHYRLGSAEVPALKGVSFEIEAGKMVCVMGPSGSGKSTLLHLMGGLDTPSSGSVVVDGSDLAKLDDEALTLFRRRSLGFIFQFFNLLPTMSAWENVALPRLLDGARLKDVRPRAVELLERVGLGERVDHKPSQLSGGEMQRVAVARALVGDPVLVLADEPTGNLDSASGQAVLDLLRGFVADEGRTVVVVTHDAKAASYADLQIRLKDGVLSGS
ncbi:MAG: ABC transporter ATP-binding protein [Actinomycetota bacterium]